MYWAMAQGNLGSILTAWGRREAGTRRLESAVLAYRRALEVFTADFAPTYRSMALSGLAEANALLDRRRLDVR
jgi:hypothetical protein